MDKTHEILKKYWGYDEFRPLQEDIINSVISGHDTLGLMPTGGGKSLTFQVPALLMDGTCLVITPLIALMKDQVENLRNRGILAAAIYSGMSHQDIVKEIDNCILGGYKFLYLSPERIATDIFNNKLPKMKISMIAVDESHCISQWGYDFRPSYLQIADIRINLPDTPLLALTATATPEVAKDIQQKLLFRVGSNVYKTSFARKNLAYVVKYNDDKTGTLLHILNRVPGSSVVYVRNRKKTKEISDWLVKNNISANYFHAGLNEEIKNERQNAWKKGDCRVIVATNAFGMGIDKPDVRTVIHIDLPDTLEAYFQEAGRAGRDGEKAYAVLIYSNADSTKLKKRIVDTYPDKEFVKRVYEALFNYYQIAEGEGIGRSFPFSIGNFCSIFHFNINQTFSALKLIEQEGHIKIEDEPNCKSKAVMSVTKEELYHINTTDQEDAVLNALLRTYSGLFCDEVYIDEVVIGKLTGMDRESVYGTLVKLRQDGAINYKPMKNEPRIQIIRDRLDSNRFSLSKDVYDIRMNQYAKRIGSVIDYATDHDHCRSQILLHYFGEKETKPCGCCDNCIENKKNRKNGTEIDSARNMIIQLLSITQTAITLPQIVETLCGCDQQVLTEALRWMLDNDEIKMEINGTVKLSIKGN